MLLLQLSTYNGTKQGQMSRRALERTTTNACCAMRNRTHRSTARPSTGTWFHAPVIFSHGQIRATACGAFVGISTCRSSTTGTCKQRQETRVPSRRSEAPTSSELQSVVYEASEGNCDVGCAQSLTYPRGVTCATCTPSFVTDHASCITHCTNSRTITRPCPPFQPSARPKVRRQQKL